MGVMGCHRPDCSNIMCDIHVDGIGYICYECRKEFEDYLQKNGIYPQTEGDIRRELQKFMKTPKGSYDQGKTMSVDEFFKSYSK